MIFFGANPHILTARSRINKKKNVSLKNFCQNFFSRFSIKKFGPPPGDRTAYPSGPKVDCKVTLPSHRGVQEKTATQKSQGVKRSIMGTFSERHLYQRSCGTCLLDVLYWIRVFHRGKGSYWVILVSGRPCQRKSSKFCSSGCVQLLRCTWFDTHNTDSRTALTPLDEWILLISQWNR